MCHYGLIWNFSYRLSSPPFVDSTSNSCNSLSCLNFTLVIGFRVSFWTSFFFFLFFFHTIYSMQYPLKDYYIRKNESARHVVDNKSVLHISSKKKKIIFNYITPTAEENDRSLQLILLQIQYLNIRLQCKSFNVYFRINRKKKKKKKNLDGLQQKKKQLY